MSEESLIYLIILALSGAIALSISAYITHREEKLKYRSERLKWLQKQTSHMLDAITYLKAAGCKKELLEKLNQRAMLFIEEISSLAPDSDLMTQINTQKENADRASADHPIISSDRDLKRFQIYTKYIEQVLLEMLEKHQITQHTAKVFGKELYFLNIVTVASAHEQQAQQLINEDDRLTALSHLKHAKAVLVRSMIPKDIKQEKIDALEPLIKELQPKKIRHEGALGEAVESLENLIDQ